MLEAFPNLEVDELVIPPPILSQRVMDQIEVDNYNTEISNLSSVFDAPLSLPETDEDKPILDSHNNPVFYVPETPNMYLY